MNIYTKKGDQGETQLLSGEKISKGHRCIEAYGTVDELNSILGLLASSLSEELTSSVKIIHTIQSTLFNAGALLATMPDRSPLSKNTLVSSEKIKLLEEKIDKMQNKLEPLKNFILPGGHETAALAHLARTVCRRVERHVVRLFGQLDRDRVSIHHQNLLIFLNRLSDFLFVLARYLNHEAGVKETILKI